MRLSQSASVSSPKGGNGHRLGTRTRKKHKRLDAICEDVFNQNRRDTIDSNDGTTSKGDSLGNDSALRRGSRVRRAPKILDSSPPPPRKRRKMSRLGKKSRGKKGKGKAKMESDDVSSSYDDSDDEELGAWRSRLRSSEKEVQLSLKGSGNRHRGKRKLFQDFEEDDKDMISVKDDLVHNNDGEKSGVVVKSLIDDEEKLHGDHVGEMSLENGVEAPRDEDGGDCNVLTSEKIDGNEDVAECGPVQPLEVDQEVVTDILVQEKHDMNDSKNDGGQNEEKHDMNNSKNDSGQSEEKHHMNDSKHDSGQNEESLNSSKSAKDPEDDKLDAEIASHPAGQVEDQEHHDELNLAEVEVEHKTIPKVENHGVVGKGISKPRIKEGRRCGLCGGGIDGKPPKRLADDSVGSDHETYSGSSASEEFNYDSWDGFGDEPGWLGRLLGPINDRYGIAGVWVHQQCAVWSPEVYFAGLGCLKNVRAALCRGRALKCTRCGRPGATLGCRVDRCPRTYHLPCARASGCIFDHRKFLIACADHRYLFQPHGHQYTQHIKKLKAKKMKMEMRKVSNDASRKDIEAEEKWMEKCGEDEEFLRRETKRLQRDLSRIAPVYIGGCRSEGENLFGGWESVAGLQDVIKCLKEVVILPLLYPEFFQNMGITPPRGVLLHGYPGTGKTLVVRALIGSCAYGEKRIAYFARKGADCLGKYVGDAERQLRLLFQVAEKSQPSIIFFDEIDGLAPVRTRQQDQTHSSVVSTLLALMDGLKPRGSVIVIGATNRPDAVDPALRRPGRFDREIYFPLPSVKDRASILALHTRKWPKPVSGPLLEWVAAKTVGFAGADLQALCAQAAVIALKRNCSWQQILSSAESNYVEGKRPLLPAFTVEERDWLEALSLSPPPCSRREAGMAASEVAGSPLPMHLIPCLLEPLLSVIISLYIDDRLWLPPRLVDAGAAIKRALVSVMDRRSLPSDRWWLYAPSIVKESSTTSEIVRNLCVAGVVDGDAFSETDDGRCESDRSLPPSFDFNPSSLFRNLCHASSKKAGYRILIAGDPKSGQKHLASCLLHCFVGSIELQKIDLATISQEGHGDMEQGISHILMKCANMKFCAVFMPRIDLWALQSIPKDSETSPSSESSRKSSLEPCRNGVGECSSLGCKSELAKESAFNGELRNASQTWKSFVEQLECICISSPLIILATSEFPCAALPHNVRQFFGSDSLVSERANISQPATPLFTVEVNGAFDHGMLINSAALDLSRDLVQQFIHFVHHRNHSRSSASVASGSHYDVERDGLNHKLVEDSGAKNQIPEVSVKKTLVPIIGKGKSTLAFAISTFGYQILTYPHFAELCWVTSKLKEGPSVDILGPWKGWPFNSCIVRPCKSLQKEASVGSLSNVKSKDKFTLVRGLLAVGFSAYRGKYMTPTEVSLEVRKVLELLVLQIGVRIQSGKDRYQFIRLFSQVAYLEDMVNNWAHSLKSMEPDVQTTPENPKLATVQSSDSLQTPADNLVQLGEKSSIQGNGFLEATFSEEWLQGSHAVCTEIANVGGDNMTEPSGWDGNGLKDPALLERGLQESTAQCSGAANVGGNSMTERPTRDENDFQEPPLMEGGLQDSTARCPGATNVGGSNTIEFPTRDRYGVLEPALMEGGLCGSPSQCSGASNRGSEDKSKSPNENEILPNILVSSNDIAPQNYYSEEIANDDNASLEKDNGVFVNKNTVEITDLDGSVVFDQSSLGISSEHNDAELESLRSRPTEDLAMVSENMQPIQHSSQPSCTESADQLKTATCNAVELRSIEIHGSHDICNQCNEGKTLEKEISAKSVSDARVPDLNLPSEAADISSESQVCAYSCCIGCIHTLHQLLKKLVTLALVHSGSSSTAEDVHDLVSSLSTTLCSTIRNLYLSGKCSSLLNEELRSETCRKLFDSQDMSAWKCGNSEHRFAKLIECACHQEKEFSEEIEPSFYDLPVITPRYVFRDGVLITTDHGEEISVHCKYDRLCLCSLIDSIVMTKHPSD